MSPGPRIRVPLSRRARLAVFDAASALKLPSVLLRSSWRTHRLLILGYHGLSLDDEHEWQPSLYIPSALFRSRLEALRNMKCAVLRLPEALRRLRSGTLPPRSVVITFDDGAYDFYHLALPLLREFGFPATVYLTSYYSGFNRPVFDVMLSYLFWKARGRDFEWPGVLQAPVRLDQPGRTAAAREIRDYARRSGLSGAAKDDLLAGLAARLGEDYGALCSRRVLHLMTASEVSQAAGCGIDIQLHTHRHRVSRIPERFVEEIEDNRSFITRATGINPVHFCYPSGVEAAEFVRVLRGAGVESAVTCQPGLAGERSDPLFLPRLLDISSLSATEFEGWVSGLAEFVPRRPVRLPPDRVFEMKREQFLEYAPEDHAESGSVSPDMMD
ncbi:MAG TPA: polysaccharide deacetylase family protein [Bryobacteraceae bacterium]|nr:polysaccharide deacetylase family protein [Bryobacteraceae bacterium]